MPESPPRRCRYCSSLVRGACPTCDRPWARSSANWTGLTREQMLAWRRFSAAWLRQHPWCMDCGAPATVTCHKPGTDYWRDRLNVAAIEGQRCRSCDAAVTTAQSQQAQRYD